MRVVIASMVVGLSLLSGCATEAGPPGQPPTTTYAATYPHALTLPRFENAEIHVLHGVDRAYVSYSIIGSGPNQYASIDTIRAVNDQGKSIAWHHQTSTGGPSDIVASNGRINVPASSLTGGDGNYFNVSDVRSSKTVRVTFHFEAGAITVPFAVVPGPGN